MEPRQDRTASENDLIVRLNRAEEALRESALNFRLIVDSIPAPVAVTSPAGEVEALNQSTLEYFGKTFEELKGWKASDVVHPDDLQRTIDAQTRAHETGQAYNVESRHRRADGIYRWFKVLGLPLRDTEGKILFWFHLLIDIDDVSGPRLSSPARSDCWKWWPRALPTQRRSQCLVQICRRHFRRLSLRRLPDRLEWSEVSDRGRSEPSGDLQRSD